MKLGKNYPGKISAESDNWFKSYGQKFDKKALFRNRVPGTNYPVPGYPDFANYPVLVTRFLTSLYLVKKIATAHLFRTACFKDIQYANHCVVPCTL